MKTLLQAWRHSLRQRSTRWIACLLATVASAPVIAADPPVLEMASGLRERGFHDYAMIYLEEIEKRTDLSDELRQVIPLEKAITLRDGVAGVRSFDDKVKQLETARLFLEEFVKNSPNHPRAAGANFELAELLVERATSESLQARSPSAGVRKAELQNSARALLAQARTVYKAALDRYQAEYEKYDPSIDKERERAKYDAREAVFVKKVDCQMRLAKLVYDEAQTYDAGSDDHKRLLLDAVRELEPIRVAYRSLLSGLYADMWRGKCFEEMGDLTKALGIYQSLLDNPGRSRAMRQLQERVLRFQLACWNDPSRRDYVLVIEKVQDWLKGGSVFGRTSPVGLGIQYEMARAYEAMGAREDLSPAEREKNLRSALATAQSINRFGGNFKDLSNQMIQRIKARLNFNQTDPKDFETAYGIAKERVPELSKKRTAIAAAVNAQEAEKLRAEAEKFIGETVRLLKLSLDLAGPRDNVDDLFRARYHYGFALFQQAQLLRASDRFLDAGIVSEFVARRYTRQTDKYLDIPKAAAILAMYSFRAASNSLPPDQRGADLPRLESLAHYISTNYSTSNEASEAWDIIGDVYVQLQKPTEAAAAYARIPESAPQYSDARMKSGLAFWDTYVQQMQLPVEKRMPREQLDALPKQSEQVLRESIVQRESKLPEGAPLPDGVVNAKLTLAQIFNQDGKYDEARQLLNEGPRSLTAAIAVPENTQREKFGVKGSIVAVAVYRELLRSFVGLKQIDPAREAMKALEKAAGGDTGSTALTGIYLELGRELEKEVQRLQAAGDPRLQDVLSSFETFLDDLANRREGQDYNSLRWVSETYFALGEGLSSGTDQSRAQSYFRKAQASLQDLLDRGEAFLPAGTRAGVEVRLVEAMIGTQEFKEARTIVDKLLAESPRRLDVQILAARLFQAWGDQGGPNDYKNYLLAVTGAKPADGGEKVMWGWHQLSERLAANLQQSASIAEFQQQYLESRYNVALCRFKYGQQQADSKKKIDQYDRARRDLVVTMSLNGEIIDDAAYARFNTLYHDIQDALVDAGARSGPVTDLERVQSVAAPTRAPAVDDAEEMAAAELEEEEPTTKTTASKTGGRKSAKSGGMDATTLGMLGGGVLLLAGAGWFALSGGKRKKPVSSKAGTPQIATPRQRSLASSATTTATTKPAAVTATTKPTAVKKPASRPKTDK
jgi:hypothetical protein